MPVMNAIASLAVKNLEQSTRWYERLFGRAPDARPVLEVAQWQFASGGWLQVCEQPDRAGGGLVTLAVSDIGEQAEHLDRLRLKNRQCTASPKLRTLMVCDPDGNTIAFAQTLDAGLGAATGLRQ